MSNEDNVIDAVIDCMKVRKKASINSMEYPDRDNRSGKEVDRRFNLNGNKVVLEHSRAESFPGQITTGFRWKQVFDELDRRLIGKLPNDSRFDFGADAASMNFADKKEQRGAIDSLEDWILRNAGGLKIHKGGTRRLVEGSYIRETPNGLKFQATLTRLETNTFLGKLMPAQGIDDDLQNQRKIRIEELLNNKLPKLESTKNRDNANLSVLVIESNDISLGNVSGISDAVFASITKFSKIEPDEIYLIETENGSWWIWILQENRRCAIQNGRFPCYIFENGTCKEKKFQ